MKSRLSRQMAQEEAADPLLLQQACAGDQAAFEMLVWRYQPMLYRFVATYVDSEQAQDVVQFVLLARLLAVRGFDAIEVSLRLRQCEYCRDFLLRQQL